MAFSSRSKTAAASSQAGRVIGKIGHAGDRIGFQPGDEAAQHRRENVLLGNAVLQRAGNRRDRAGGIGADRVGLDRGKAGEMVFDAELFDLVLLRVGAQGGKFPAELGIVAGQGLVEQLVIAQGKGDAKLCHGLGDLEQDRCILAPD